MLLLSYNDNGIMSTGASGLNSFMTSNGHIWVEECTALLLYTNSTCDKHFSHPFKFFLIMVCDNIENILFAISVCALFAGDTF
jgi:hypothetical protein